MSENLQILKNRYELAIVGCGPAGMAASLNAKIRKRDFILLGTELCSPKLAKAPRIENWLEFPEIDGKELRQRFLEHLKKNEIPIVSFRVNNIKAAGEGGTAALRAVKYLDNLKKTQDTKASVL